MNPNGFRLVRAAGLALGLLALLAGCRHDKKRVIGVIAPWR